MKMVALIRSIQACLSDDLLSPKWLARRKPSDHPAFGHCYVAAEALFHLWGKRNGYRPKVISGKGLTHWFLENAEGEKADPTAGQGWKGGRIPYERGRHCGFLTQCPSRRCRRLIRRIRSSGGNPRRYPRTWPGGSS
jgi:hypothetical protein